LEKELIYYAHELNPRFKDLLLLPLSDAHYGDPLFSEPHYNRTLDFLKNTRNAYTILNGDLCDSATRLSVGDVYSQKLTPQQQRDFHIKKLKPIKHKILGVTTGNHEYRIYRESGVDISQDIAEALGAPYRPSGILLKISFGDNNKSTPGKPYTYFVYATHGYGGARTKSAKAVKVERLGTWLHADCLHPQTKVLNGNLEWVELGGVREGDELIGVSEYPEFGLCRRLLHTNVTYVQHKHADTLRLSLNDGTQFVTTPEHLWLTKRRHDGSKLGGRYNWYKTKDIKQGDSLLKVFDVWKTRNRWEDGYIAGLLDGEGSITVTNPQRNRQVAFSQKEGIVLEYVEDYLADNQIYYHKYLNDKDVANLIMRRDAAKIIGMVQPLRLRGKARNLVEKGLQHPQTVQVVSVESSGQQEVIRIETDEHTFIAEGIATHNCYIMSHDHVVNVAPDVYLIPDPRTHKDEESGFQVGKVAAHRKMLVKANAYLKWGGYAEMGGFPPVDLDIPVIKFAGTGKPRVTVEV